LHLATIVVAAFLVVAGYVLIFRSVNEHFQLQHEINAKLPADRKFEPLFWSLGTQRRFRHLQEEVLPGSPRLKKSRWLGAIGLVLVISGILILLAELTKPPAIRGSGITVEERPFRAAKAFRGMAGFSPSVPFLPPLALTHYSRRLFLDQRELNLLLHRIYAIDQHSNFLPQPVNSP
jgi:hypothetical protein